MTKRPQTGTYDRRAIMKDAHKRYRDGRRLGLGWPFAHCLQTAWRAARIRHERDVTADTMRMIAGMIEDHASRRIVLAPEIGKGKNHEKDCMGFRLLYPDRRRRMADIGRPVC